MNIWPFSRKPVPAETKSLGNPTAEEIAVLTGVTGSALSVSVQVALSVPAVASAVRVISEAPAALGARVMRTIDGRETEATDHPASRLVTREPNSWSSAFELIRDLVAYALVYDKGALAFVNRVGSEIREIVLYTPDHFTVEYSTDGRNEPSYRINNQPVPADNVIHVRGPFSRSPINQAADAILAAKDMELHAGSLFRNGARPGGVIEVPGKLGEESLKNMKAAWKAAHEGAANAGKTAILWDGAKFAPMVMNSTDSQFLENRKFQLLEIARAFRVPPSMLFELDRATWSNAQQMGREFLVYCLEPWLKTLEGAMTRGLFSAEERASYRIVFDRDDLTRADLGERASAYSSLIASKIINPNEARHWEGLEPYAGGEEFLNPNITSQPAQAGGDHAA